LCRYGAGGVNNRTFAVTRPAASGGGRCEVADGHVDSQPCNEKPCPRLTDCRGKWDGWSSCTAPCGGGTKTRRWKVREPAVAGGSCVMKDAKESLPCNEVACAVSCHGGWAPWWGCTRLIQLIHSLKAPGFKP
jgi:hypothetical protein